MRPALDKRNSALFSSTCAVNPRDRRRGRQKILLVLDQDGAEVANVTPLVSGALFTVGLRFPRFAANISAQCFFAQQYIPFFTIPF